MPTWPSTFRPPLVDGFSETSAITVVESPADVGSGKTRVRSTAMLAKISMSFLFSATEYEAFKEFYKTELAWGSLSYLWTHPLTLDVLRVRMEGNYTAVPRDRKGRQVVSFTVKVLR